ncbi:hypothetical protein EOL70_04415 [Leucothrix sargassi]|nr:hypothetical protein EOL70_04415 [Leucothrix sargassi]
MLSFTRAKSLSLSRIFRSRLSKTCLPLLIAGAPFVSSTAFASTTPFDAACFPPPATNAEADALTWVDGGLSIYSIGNNTNTLGYRESGFEDVVTQLGGTLTALDGSNDYTFTGDTGAGSATSSVGTFSNGTMSFSTSYTTTNRSEFRVTTAANFYSGDSGNGVYIFPEQGGSTGDFYTVSIDFTNPVDAFSFDLVDIFDTINTNSPELNYEIFVDGRRVAYLNGVLLGDDQVGPLTLYDGSGNVQGTMNAGQNIENNFAFIASTPISNVSIKHLFVGGTINANARDPHGLDMLTYSTDIPCNETTLTLVNSVINDDNGSSVDTDWTLTATDGATTYSGVEGDANITAVSVDAGTYTLSQDGPRNYDLEMLSCTGAADTNLSDGLTIVEGENVTCTFVNNDKVQQAQLTPGYCGAAVAEAYLKDGMGIGPEDNYHINGVGTSSEPTYDPAKDPDVFFSDVYQRLADGSVATYFTGTPVASVSGELSTITYSNLSTVSGNSADQTNAAEFWRITARVDGIPGQTYSMSISHGADNGFPFELLTYWLSDAAGNVLDASGSWFKGWNTERNGDGLTLPITYTLPASASSEVYLNVLMLDPQANWGPIQFDYDCPLDVSDADTSYGNASHGVVAGMQLGAAVDTDSGPLASPNADADGADDDGVSAFPTLTAGESYYTIPYSNLSATGSGTIHAWLDFDGNGSFDSSEYTTTTVTSGLVDADLTWVSQSNISEGTTFVRLRYTTDALTSADAHTVVASDGEVEDYALTVAPALPFVTLDNPTGLCKANWYKWETPFQQSTPSTNPLVVPINNFNPDYFALDRRDTSLGADMWYGAISAPQSSSLNVDPGFVPTEVTSNTSSLDYGIFYNAYTPNSTVSFTVTDANYWDGHAIAVFDKSGNQIARFPDQTSVNNGVFYYLSAALDPSYLALDPEGLQKPTSSWSETLSFTAPADGIVYIHTISTDEKARRSILTFDGSGMCAHDYSDSPTSYGDASHQIVAGMALGSSVDADGGSIASVDASADGADDDAIVTSFPTLITGLTDYRFGHADFTATGTGTVHIWIDFDGDGVYETNEYTFTTVTNGLTELKDPEWNGVTTMSPGTTFARIRYTTDPNVNASTPSGAAIDGEVEDYQLTVIAPAPADPITPQVPGICVPATNNPSYIDFDFDDGTNQGWEVLQANQYANRPLSSGSPNNNMGNMSGTLPNVTRVASINGGAGVPSPSGGHFLGSYDALGGEPIWGHTYAEPQDFTSLYNAALTFERWNWHPTASYSEKNHDFVIWGETGKLIYNYPNFDAATEAALAAGEWITIEKLIAPDAEWFYVNDTGVGSTSTTVATQANFIDVLSGVTRVGFNPENGAGWNYALSSRGANANANNVERYAVDTIRTIVCDTQPTLTLLKTTINNNGGDAVDTDWTLTATESSGSYSISGIEGDTAITVRPLIAGLTYTLSESGGPVNYEQTSLVCTGTADTNPSDGLTLAAGENAVCTFTNDDLPVDEIDLPAQCGAWNHKGWSTYAVPGLHDTEVEFNSGDPANDPYSNLALIRESSGEILSYFGTATETVSGTVGTLPGSNLSTSARDDAGHQAEYHTTVYRLDGLPGTTDTVSVDAIGGFEFTAYWVKNSAGTVLSSLDFQPTWSGGIGIGESLPVSITYPADGVVYLYVSQFDPSQAYGRPNVSGYVCPSDYGDAPDSYGSTQAANGAEHTITNPLYLGASLPDAEADSVPSPTADTDDANASANDEDGVTTFSALATQDSHYSITVNATNDTSLVARLMAWIDFDGNGTFDADEAAVRVVPVGTSSGSFVVSWSSIPADIQDGLTYVRLRITTDSINASEANGLKSDGEVEDYTLLITTSGATVSGRVYIDADSNGLEGVSESGIGGTVVVLRDTSSGVCRSVTTNGGGYYSFSAVADSSYEIYQAHGETTPTPQNCGTGFANNPTGYISTTADTLSVTVSSSDVTNQDFGEVAGATNSTTGVSTGYGITFEPDHQSEVQPGNVVFYAHTFATEAEGSVNFTSTAGGNTASGWSHLIYRDANCDGTLNGTEGNTPIQGINFGVATGGRVCIINKVYAPANAPALDQYSVDTTATFSYAGGALPSTALTVTDLTTTGQNSEPTTNAATPAVGASNLVLSKTVENVTQATDEAATLNQAKPGDVLKYRIYYRNTGTGPITDLAVNDSVPAYSGLVPGSVICGVVPAGLTCLPAVNDPSIEWLFGGTLSGGASGSVSYEVVVDN